jgi:hypothetical protein
LDLDPPRYELEAIPIEGAMKKAEEDHRGSEPSSLLPTKELPFAKSHERYASR